MLRPQGYATVVSDRLVEHDTVVCGHCNRIVMVKPGTASTVYLLQQLHIDPVTRVATTVTHEEPGASCRICMRAVCLTCHDDGRCLPLERRIEQMEALGRFRRGL